MVFWVSFLVFLAGMLTYMLFPRNDLYQLHMIQEEGNIVTFVNQHQAAKDYMYQVITWKPGTAVDSQIYVFPYKDLNHMLPHGMTADISYTMESEEEKSRLNPQHALDSTTVGGSFTSAVVCVEGDTLVQCPGSTGAQKYVITYGDPDWWTDRSHPDAVDRMAWFKAILKRTRGSANCGLLVYRDTINPDAAGEANLYSIDNSQRYKGFQTISGMSVVYPALTNNLERLGINMCQGECGEPLSDLFFCMTPVSDPYRGAPAFHWDILNNTGIGSDEDTIGTALQGSFTETTKVNLTLENSYTIAGVITPGSGLTPSTDLLGNLIKMVCDSTCTLTAGDVSIIDIPTTKGMSFIYRVKNSAPKQELKIYYSNAKGQFTEKIASAETLPASEAKPQLAWRKDERSRIKALRIYTSSADEGDLMHNIKVDKKRFGL